MDAPSVDLYYHCLYMLMDAAINGTAHPGAPPTGFEEWAGHSGRPCNMQEAKDRFIKREAITPAHSTSAHDSSPTIMSLNSQNHASLLNHREHLDMMPRYHKSNRQILHEERERSHSDLMASMLGNFG